MLSHTAQLHTSPNATTACVPSLVRPGRAGGGMAVSVLPASSECRDVFFRRRPNASVFGDSSPFVTGAAMTPASWTFPATNPVTSALEQQKSMPLLFNPSPVPASYGKGLQNLQSPAPAEKAKSQTPAWSERLSHLAKAGLCFGTLLLVKRFPGAKPKLQGTLLPLDWKEWLKVGLGIAGMAQINQSLNWKPPTWLAAMINVIVVNPWVAGFTKRNLIQGMVLAPVVGGMAGGAHFLSDQAEKPLEEKLKIPPIVTRFLVSIPMMAVGLKMLPWVSNAIPHMQTASRGAALETGLLSSCLSGCCSSMICAVDVLNLFKAFFDYMKGDKPSAKGGRP